MASEMDRRDFLASTPAAMLLAGGVLSQQPMTMSAQSLASRVAKIEPFDYQGVRLRPSRWKEQSDAAREFYFALSDDDILHGNRADRGLPAPGRVLGGWCGRNSNSVLGQWLSGMSRLYRATGDARMRDKAVTLMTEWAKTVKPDGDAGMRHYYNLAYYKDVASLYVNLYVPSDVTWQRPDGNVIVEQETLYPEGETSVIMVKPARPSRFALKLRVPSWTKGMSVKVNGTPANVECAPGTWAVLDRTWNTGDRVDVTIPLTLRMEAVDRQHPDRVAVMRGPVVLILEGTYHAGAFRLPQRNDDLATWLVPEPWSRPLAILGPGDETRDTKSVFRVVPPDKSAVRLKFRPFYDAGEGYPYFMYFDRKGLPYKLW